jgi:signal transduction histidine kinase
MTFVNWLIYRTIKKTNLFKYIFCFWASHLFHVSLSAAGGNSQNPYAWILVLAPCPLIYYFQLKILSEFVPSTRSSKYMTLIYCSGFATALIMSFFSQNFTLVTAPIMFSVGINGTHMCWVYWKGIRNQKDRTLDKILLLFTISFVIHGLDYPFLRPIPEFAIFGFSYYLFNIVGFAVILPTMAMKQAGDIQRIHLENLVKERTEQLLQQSKLSALGEMAAGVAHEINNPLAIIVGRSEQVLNRLGREELADTYLKESMTIMQDTAFRISRIIKALLDFSKQGLQTPYSIETLDKIVSDIKVLCEERFRYYGVILLMEGDLNLQVRTRGPQISQVLLNLLNNAFDSVEKENDRWVKVIVEITDDFVRISVVDSGKGIPLENRDKIMQPFFTSKEVGKGIGLGLSISKGIIENHGGKFYLDNNRSHTTFVVELPIVEDL